MSEELTGNLLVVQSGSSTATFNASLAGVVTEGLNHSCIEDIYGCLNGIQGLLNESFIDLAEESQQTIRSLCYTPGAALGTSQHKIKSPQELDQILTILEAHNIRFFFNIGGREAQQTAWALAQAAEAKGYDLRVIGIPKSANNDLSMSDHTPGYGSVIKYIATTIREISLDHHSRSQQGLVTIVEVMGKHSGWIAAGSILAKRKGNEQDAPHLILMPERAFAEQEFITSVQQILQKNKNCVIVASEGLVDAEGNYIAGKTETEIEYGIGEKLAHILKTSLDLQATTIRLGLTQLLAAQSISKTDSNEAFLAGQAAIQAAVAGKSAKMVTLLRGETDSYSCETGLAALEEFVEAGNKPFPESWLNANGISGISHQFFKYANPLIQGEIEISHDHGLPRFASLSMRRITKKVSPAALS